jgi:hypothetical protein
VFSGIVTGRIFKKEVAAQAETLFKNRLFQANILIYACQKTYCFYKTNQTL